jgi:antitoxin (DNA-binding transcriptional repressor) of toxin-antitoxin stability system
MPLLNARQLHNETSAILDALAKGKSFQISRRGKIIGTLQPTGAERSDWSEIMEEVWTAQAKVSRRTRNPVLAERERRRR